MVSSLTEGGEIIEQIGDRILGRVALDDILDPVTGEVLVEANQEIDEDSGQEDRRCRPRKTQNPFGADLSEPARHLRQVLRP